MADIRFNINFKFLMKVIVSAGLLAWILSRIPVDSLVLSLAKCQWTSLILSFVTVNFCILVSALKWRPLLTVYGIQIPFARLLSFYYAGLFANNFLPSSIGGDTLRIYKVARVSGKIKEAAASVVMERLLSSLALALTAAAALGLVSKLGGENFICWVVGGIAAACLAVMGILFCCPFRENSKAGQWLCRMGGYREHPYVLGKVLLLSFLFQGLLVLANVFAFQSAGANMPLLNHFLYIPVIMAVSMLPLSINGLGIREGMYIALYSYAGLDQATALLCSLLFFTLVTVASLVGGVIIGLESIREALERNRHAEYL